MNLFYFGCSLSSNPYPDKPIRLAELLNLKLKNLAVPAGSNQLQCRRLQKEIINNTIHSTDICVWQITYAQRVFTRLPNNKLQEADYEQNKFEKGYMHYVTSDANIFDKKTRIDLLCNSPMNEVYNKNFDIEDELEVLLFSLIMLKKICPNLFVYLGADPVIPVQYQKIFFSQLQIHNIEFLSESYLGWAIKNKLPIDDTYHPCAPAAIKFAEEMLYPRLVSLKP